MFKIIISYALRNLLRTRLRSFFTLFSVALIIMLYTVLTSVGDSFTKQIAIVMENKNIDIAIQAKYAATPVSSVIDSATLDAITHLEEVKSFNTLLIGRQRLEGKASIFILGVSDFNAFSTQLGFNITKGRTLKKSHREIVVGEKMAALFALDLGSDLKLNSGKKYTVVGIYSSWLNFLNSGVVLDLQSAQELTAKPDKASLVFLTLNDTIRTSEVIAKINTQFPEMRAVESQQLPDYFGPIKSAFYFSKIVSILTLFIAVFVLLNTFIMAISERTKEIGILSAIGWSRQMIIAIFLLESLMLSFAGGVMGYLFSYPVMAIIQSKFTNMTMYLPSAPSIEVFFNVLVMCLIIGVLSIIFPALYGTKMHIAKAIRHE